MPPYIPYFPCRLNSCCFCLSVEEGAILIGWICLIYGSIKAVITFLALIFAIIFGCDDPSVRHWGCLNALILSMFLGVYLVVLGILVLFGVAEKNELLLGVSILLGLIFFIFGILIILILAFYGSKYMLINLISVVGIGIYFLLVVYSYYMDLIEENPQEPSTPEEEK